MKPLVLRRPAVPTLAGPHPDLPPAGPTSARLSLPAPATLAVAGVVPLLAGLFYGRGSRWADHVTDFSLVLFPALAAASSWRAAAIRTDHEATGWRLLALAWSTWALAGAIWAADGLHGGRAFPSFADALFLCSCIPAVAGVLVLAGPSTSRLIRLRTALDAVVVGTGLSLLTWILVLGPVAHDRSYSGLSRAIALAYPLADLIALSFVLVLTARGGTRGRPTWLLVTAGLLAVSISDSLYVRAGLQDAYASGGIVNALYAVGFACLAVAPHVRASEQAAPRVAAWQEWMLYLPLAACAVAVPLADITSHPVLFVAYLLLIAAAAVRQYLIIVEKSRLAHSLEDRVRLRTAELHRQQDLLQVVVDNLHDAVVACDAGGRLTMFNAAAVRLHETGNAHVPIESVPEAYGLLSPDTLRPLAIADLPLLRALRGEIVDSESMVVRSASGRLSYVSCSGRGLLDDDGAVTGAVVAMHDVTDQRQAQHALETGPLRDELTGLGNRPQFIDDLDRAIGTAAFTKAPLAVLLLDLDDFKNVNDSLGHVAGDALLIEVADRIATALRPGDVAARLGGDEFVLLLENTSVEQARDVAAHVLRSLDEPAVIAGTTVTSSASIGIAAFDGNSAAPDNLLGAADLAMYLAKERGKGGAAVFEPQMQRDAIARLQMESDLRRAICTDALTLAYQPIIDLQSGDMPGVEALIRWEHPVRGTVSPCEFIPLAEATGLILPLGEWVLREAARQAEQWKRQFPAANLAVSVNVSARQLERHGLLTVLDGLLADGLDPQHLIVEITETAVGRDDAVSALTLDALRNRGIHLAVDDFGTGYSSLGRLRSAPVSRLKIDRIFVSEIGHNGSEVPLVDATMAMARGLGMGVVAEGIETDEQLRYLIRLGCPQGQGFLLSPPVDAAAVCGILSGDRPWSERCSAIA